MRSSSALDRWNMRHEHAFLVKLFGDGMSQFQMAVDQVNIASIKHIDDQRVVARAYALTEQNLINGV